MKAIVINILNWLTEKSNKMKDLADIASCYVLDAIIKFLGTSIPIFPVILILSLIYSRFWIVLLAMLFVFIVLIISIIITLCSMVYFSITSSTLSWIGNKITKQEA